MTDVQDCMVRCGDCGWQGPVRDLVLADSVHHCPKCGREFAKFPPIQFDTDLKQGD